MERKILQNNWIEMRGQISEWWDDLTDEDLDRIDGNPDQLITVLQERYGYTRNLAFMEVKIRMARYRPGGAHCWSWRAGHPNRNRPPGRKPGRQRSGTPSGW